jgi:LmbE family N-acetylglucosaminyl deacetylase
MKHLFSPLLPREPLTGPVLVLAAHPDDEVIGAGAMLAFHASRGHAVTVVHATDGARGDPGQREHDIRAVRRREGDEALARLGIGKARHWDYPDGELPEHLPALTERVAAVMREVQPRTLYSFHAGEAHRDHRAIAAATAAAAAASLPADCRCLLYGVNFVPPGGTLFDVTDMYPRSYRALQAYASQNVYIDLPGMSEHRCRAATVNVDVPGVLYGELFLDLRPEELAAVHVLQDRLHRFVQRETP